MTALLQSACVRANGSDQDRDGVMDRFVRRSLRVQAGSGDESQSRRVADSSLATHLSSLMLPELCGLCGPRTS